MMARWMLAAMAFSALVAVAAYAAEQLLRLTRGARRLPWILAIVVSVSWPFLAAWFVRPEPAPAIRGAVIEGLNAPLTPVAATPSFDWLAALDRLGPMLLTLWGLGALRFPEPVTSR